MSSARGQDVGTPKAVGTSAGKAECGGGSGRLGECGANLFCVVLPALASFSLPAASGQNILKTCSSVWTDDGKMRPGTGAGAGGLHSEQL